MKKFCYVWLLGFPLWALPTMTHAVITVVLDGHGWKRVAKLINRLELILWSWSYRLRDKAGVSSKMMDNWRTKHLVAKDETGGGGATGGGTGGIQGDGSNYP